MLIITSAIITFLIVSLVAAILTAARLTSEIEGLDIEAEWQAQTIRLQNERIDELELRCQRLHRQLVNRTPRPLGPLVEDWKLVRGRRIRTYRN